MMALCVCGQNANQNETIDDGTDDLVPSGINEDMLRQIEPTYLKEVAVPSAWSSNWFVGVSGGTSAFVGKPHGKTCSTGWNLPLAISRQENGSRQRLVVGLVSRFSVQGCQQECPWLQDGSCGFSLECDQQFCQRPCHHTKDGDSFRMLVAVLSITRDNGKSPFVINYGVIGQYRLTKRLAVNMELGGATTFRDFDGWAHPNKFGDNLFTLSAGLTFNIGKVGWKKVVDAAPYINQNKWLADYTNDLLARNQKLTKLMRRMPMPSLKWERSWDWRIAESLCRPPDILCG